MGNCTVGDVHRLFDPIFGSRSDRPCCPLWCIVERPLGREVVSAAVAPIIGISSEIVPIYSTPPFPMATSAQAPPSALMSKIPSFILRVREL